LIEGESFLLAAGVAAQQEYLSLPWVIVTAWLGAISGDHFFFALGRWKGQSILKKRPALERRLTGLIRLIEGRQTSVILGFRFVYGCRMIGPLALGSAGVPTRSFAFLDTLSGFVWSTTFALVGYGCGATLGPVIAHPLSRIALSLCVVAIIALSLRYLTRSLLADEGRPPLG
jgi:membrane protein DedA with SNARE-associated domain